MENGSWIANKKACAFYEVSGNTLRRWADNNKIIYKRNPSNQRVYFIPDRNNERIKDIKLSYKQNFIYCRVSSYKQKDDLDRQCMLLSNRYPDHKIIRDIGSGLNYKRKGLLSLLEQSSKGTVGQIIVSSKDRLCRFGFELLEWLFVQNNTELLVLEHNNKSKEEEFTEDILAILQVFACRWNGKRRYTIKDKKDKIEVNINTKETITIME